jgi:hypothetical protein
MTERKAVIKNADMAEEMQTDAIDCAGAVRCLDAQNTQAGTCCGKAVVTIGTSPSTQSNV